jgi:hypothetical protein
MIWNLLMMAAAGWIMIYPTSLHPYFALFYQREPGTNQSLNALFRGEYPVVTTDKSMALYFTNRIRLPEKRRDATQH